MSVSLDNTATPKRSEYSFGDLSQRIVCWKLHSSNPNIPSVRYRCFLPAVGFRKLGIKNIFYQGNDSINFKEKIDSIIFVKSFTDHDLLLARKAIEVGIPIFIDICDDLFFMSDFLSACNNKQALKISSHVQNFYEMANIAQAVITTGEVLYEKIRSVVGCSIPIFMVPDGIETEEIRNLSYMFPLKQRIDWLFSHGMQHFLSQGIPRTLKYIFGHRYHVNKGKTNNPRNNVKATQSSLELTANQVLWFGTSGIEHVFGITDLLLVQSDLEQLYKHIKFHLLVMSDSTELFNKHIGKFNFPVFFKPWSQSGVMAELKKSKAVILPNQLNDFSRAKSANRALLALHHGVPVVATVTPALKIFGNCIESDFYQGLKKYLENETYRMGQVQKAQEIIKTEFNEEIIIKKWLRALGWL